MESGKIIVVANQKGGVAKTSTVRNLSYALAEMGKKVLVVDFDPQYNLTTSFGVLPTQTPCNTEGIPIQPGEKKAPTRSPEYQYEQAKLIRQHYQPGSKVVLDENMEDPYCEMPAGLTGIVDSVDDLGQIHCHWENGSSLALIPGVDHFHQDMTQEPVIESSEEQEPDLEL